MHLVILAAGRGTRLRELGESRQKWLLEVDGATLADRQLDGARAAGVESLCVVTGHAAGGVQRFLRDRGAAARIVHNPRFDDLNNWYSVLLALRDLPPGDGERVVVFNSDLCARPEWFAAFLTDAAATDHESLIAVDPRRELTDESMKVSTSRDDPARLEAIGKVGVERPAGEYVGMFMARGAAREALEARLAGFVDSPADADQWYERAIGLTAASGTPWVVWPTPDSAWVEIDDAADHALAERDRL